MFGGMLPRPLGLLLAVTLLAGLATRTALAASDADVHALIDTLKPVAEAIVIDGDGSDWGAIPTFSDPLGDAPSDANDIVGVAIAPLEDELLVRIDTAGTPPTGRWFWITFDFLGQQNLDVKMSFNPFFADDIDAFPEGVAPPARVFSDVAEWAIGSVFEARIPYASLDPLLPVSMQGKLSGAGARSWVRVWAFTGEPFFSEVDYGSAVGSFRLIDTPYTLDPPLPAGATDPVETRLPLQGLWYVGQGSHGFGTHAGIPWAYDLHQVDNALLPEDPPGSTDNTDNYSFGKQILAPLAGTVFSLENDEPDIPAYTGGATPSNFMFLEIPGDVGLLFSHTKLGSIPQAPLDPVGAGAVIGAVGNSGAPFTWAHLHYEAQDLIAPGFPSLPMAFTDVEVGLNPTQSDPWRRHVGTWGVREGFLVQRSGAFVPALGAWGTVAAAAVFLAGGALLLAVRRLQRG